MNNAKTVRKWWWPWQSEKIEMMLEGNAAEGWMLKNAGSMLVSFTFEKREPSQIRYCIDYQEKEKPEYLTLLADAGWKLEQKASGWYIWSMTYDGARPELYTDADSLIRRSNAILGTLTAVFAAQLPLIAVNIRNVDGMPPVVMGFFILWGFLVAVMAGMIIGTALGVRKLKQRKKNSLREN